MPAEWAAGVVDAVQRWARLHAATDAPWSCLGPAVPGPDPGWLALDTTALPDLAAAVREVWLAGPDGPAAPGPVFLVDEVRAVDGGLLLRVPEGLSAAAGTAWSPLAGRRELLDALLAGLCAAGPAPLAAALAQQRIDTAPDAGVVHPAGLSAEQAQAYRACRTPGLRLVWGPAGRATEAVLARAVADLARAGSRVLLLATAGAALDAVVAGVVEQLEPEPGEVVRVGPAQLDAVAEHAGVALDLLAAADTAADDTRRAAVGRRLATIAERVPAIAALTAALAGYDDEAFRGAASRIAAERELEDLELRLGAAAAVVRTARADHVAAVGAVAEVEREAAGHAAARAAMDQVDTVTEELRRLDRELARHRSELAVAKAWAWGGTGRLDRHRRIRTARAAAAALARVERGAGPRRAALQWQLMQARAAVGNDTRSTLVDIDRRRAAAAAAVAAAQAQLSRAEAYADELAQLAAAAQTRGSATAADRAIVSAAESGDLPARHVLLTRLRRQQHATGDAARLGAEHRALGERASADRAAARDRIVAAARVVAAPLAGARLLAEPEPPDPAAFDVLLLAGAEAAPLADVLLALTLARTTAVLVGDFQLGGPALDAEARVAATIDPALATWAAGTCFSHARIDTAEEAVDAEGCVAMVREFRAVPTAVPTGTPAAGPTWSAARTS